MERNVNHKLLLFSFSSELNKDNLSSDFIDFFKYYFQEQKFTDEIEFNLKFYIFLLQSYIEYLKIPDKKLIDFWEKEIKPFLLKKYSFEQSGIFNVNADIKFLIKGIDKLIKKSKYITINKAEEEFENNLEIIKINDEEELINSNINKFKKNKNDNIGNNKDFKRTVSMNDLKNHSPTIASKSTAVSIYDELNNKIDDSRSTLSTDNYNKSKVQEITPFLLMNLKLRE